jgi:hypothetical protein
MKTFEKIYESSKRDKDKTKELLDLLTKAADLAVELDLFKFSMDINYCYDKISRYTCFDNYEK